MRILVKGGVWKNTEDEILKAAVMKYGKNQWARVASLLNRKSAKQCKVRWYEWLDPSIKKTEWTREEEEKLLHLAKLMPNQWRTIAPIVGRTAGQCMEHYERLLDQAQEGKVEEMNVDDPRRLRPGEIDPTPETKPARPDPIDMDEDEKEMLSEARARLANTKGKKAKRKAREKMLEESRRLAMLQKRRELKAAGIESRLNVTGKRKYMDYAREIPFQKVPELGEFDISEENETARQLSLDPKAFGVQLQKLEGKNAREEEERARKRDKKLMNNLFKENAPAAVLKIAAETDPSALRRRTPLELPAPQITERELEEIVKLGKTSGGLLAGADGEISATQALVGDYSQALRAAQTPLRTPLQTQDVVLQEAKNLLALRNMTPLMGGEQPLPELYEGTGFGGAAPRKAVHATPNTLLAAHALPGAQGVMTVAAGNSTPAWSVPGTPGGASVASSSVAGRSASFRDEFGLNSATPLNDRDDFSVSDMSSVRGFSKADKAQRAKSLLSKLQSLPEPEYSYEVSLPAAPEEDESERDVMSGKPEDAADVEARLQRQRQIALQREMERRSAVLKRGLPRPRQLLDSLAEPSLSSSAYPAELVKASAIVNREMLELLHYEDVVYPHEDSVAKKAQFLAENFQIIEREELQAAAELIEEELRKNTDLSALESSTITKIAEEAPKKMFVPDYSLPAGGVFKIPATEEESINSLSAQWQALQARFEKDKKRVNKMENKQQLLTQGYAQRAISLRKTIEENHRMFSQASLDLDCLQVVREQELKVATKRLERLKREASESEAAEAQMQEKYADLLRFAHTCGLSV